MAHNRTVFDKSLSRFLISLNDSEKQDFKYATLEDVNVAISNIQDEHGRQRKMRNMNRIRGFLEAMEQFGSVVEVILNTSNFIAFIWGPVKFLLLIAKTWTESLDVLLDAYEQIGETIPLLVKYEGLFTSSFHMHRVLGYIYEDILEFHRRALVVFRRKAWRQLFHSSWKTFSTEFGRLLAGLKDHVTLIERQASLSEIEMNQEARKAQEDRFLKAERTEHDRQLMVVTDKINPINITVDQENVSSHWLKGQSFGLWLLENSKMKTWLDPTHIEEPLLWIKGIPGAGKTVLASRLIAYMQELGTMSIAFFYFRGDDSDRNSLSAMLKSLLCQLLDFNSDVLPFIYEECVKSREVTTESLKTLKSFFTLALEHREPVWIVLDGMDECDAKERKKILSWILPLIGSDDISTHIRLLLVSRDEGDFGKRFAKTPSITLQEMAAHTQEIRVYTTRKMKKIQEKFDLSKQEVKEMSEQVNSGAKGMFIFARLILKHLKSQTSLARLRTEVNPSQFPDGLDQVYERIVKRIFTNPQTAERESAKSILEWVVCAKRPLRFNELQATFSINLDEEVIDFESRCLRPNSPDQCHFVVKSLCGSLVEVLKGNVIHLVHDTAKIYLTRERNGEPPKVNIHKKEFEISTICLHYMSIHSFSPSLKDEEIAHYLSKGYYAFQEYAMAYCLDHLEAFIASASEKSHQSLVMISKILERFLHMNLGNYLTEKLSDTGPEGHELLNYLRQRALAVKSLVNLKYKTISIVKPNDRIPLQTQLERRRTLFESFVLGNFSGDISLHKQYSIFYGPSEGWFKCPSLNCYGFWEGFPNLEARELHTQKHERPFRCGSKGCPWEILGFGTIAELEKHKKSAHPTLLQEADFPSPVSVIPSPLLVATPLTRTPRNLDDTKKTLGIGVENGYNKDVLDIIGNQLGQLDISKVPTNFRTVEEDWFAIYNSRAPLSLDIELVHTSFEQDCISDVRFNLDRSLIAVLLTNGFAVYEIGYPNIEIWRVTRASFRSPRSIAFVRNSLAISNDRYSIEIWSVRTKSLKLSLDGHSDEIYGIEYARDDIIASASSDSSVRLWDSTNGLLHTFSDHESGGFTSVAFSLDTKLLAAGSFSSRKNVYLWNLESKSLIHIFEGHTDVVHSVAFSIFGDEIYSTSSDRTMKTWEIARHTDSDSGCVDTLNGPLDLCLSVDVIADGESLVLGSMDRGTYIYNTHRKMMIAALFGHQEGIISARCCSTISGNLFVTGSIDKTVRIWKYKSKDRSE